ncbi:helix-turn-helix transcriptional regulator [Mycoplasmatota bacterium]|nr:helix-turn-helix transcriptional regulator [Mycoplasmatota bacterium]
MAKEQLKTLTEPMYYILLSLTTPHHGYGIMQNVENITSQRVRIGAGTLYALLSRFEKEGFIVRQSDDDRRKNYVLTAKGKTLLYNEFERINKLVSDGKKILRRGDCDE